MGNPYLAGYEQYLRRPNLELTQTESQSSYLQASHSLLSNNFPAGTSAAAVVTNAPVVVSEPAQPVASLQALHDGASGPSSTRPQTPTTLNIVTRPPGGNLGQAAPSAVEITISTEPDEEPGEAPLVSHLQGLTVQQMLDLDIDALVLKIDRHHIQAKKAVLDHFMETKARLMQTQNDAVDEERQKGSVQLATKEEEVKLLKAELDTTRGKAHRLWDLVGRACAVYDQAKERRRAMLMQYQVFCAWRHQAAILARRRRMLARAERWDAEARLKRNVFRAWFREAMRAHRVTVNNRYIQEVDSAKRLIHEHYQGQVAELQRMLADAHVQLEREAEARAKLEDNMKRAFMRGVCALNIEAMNIMKRGGPQGGGGANPAAGQPPVLEQQVPEPPAASASAPMGMAYNVQPASAPPTQETVNLDVRGSITLSPTHYSMPATATGQILSSSGGMGAFPVAGATASTFGHQPAGSTSINGVTRNHMSAPLAYTPGGGASSRPASSSGLGGPVMGAGGNPLVMKAAAGLPQQSMAAPLPMGSAAGADGGPLVRETAQTFYQRPQVLVTRGPTVGAGLKSSDAPRPRTGAPLPTVRLN